MTQMRCEACGSEFALELRQVLAVLLEHFVDHLLDLGQREHGGAQRVVGHGLEDQLRVAGNGGLDSSLSR